VNEFVYEDSEQEEELHKQQKILFGNNDNDKNKNKNEQYYKNYDSIITKAPTYHERLCYKIECPICNKKVNLNSINIYFKTAKCNIFRADFTPEELNNIERNIKTRTIKK